MPTARHKGMQNRNVIRKTWAKDPAQLEIHVQVSKHVKLEMELQEWMKWEVNYISVADEVSTFHDMFLLPEVFDIWYLAYNIPRSFVWSANNADYQYHMKTDDESYVAVKRLIHELVIRNS